MSSVSGGAEVADPISICSVWQHEEINVDRHWPGSTYGSCVTSVNTLQANWEHIGKKKKKKLLNLSKNSFAWKRPHGFCTSVEFAAVLWTEAALPPPSSLSSRSYSDVLSPQGDCWRVYRRRAASMPYHRHRHQAHNHWTALSTLLVRLTTTAVASIYHQANGSISRGSKHIYFLML